MPPTLSCARSELRPRPTWGPAPCLGGGPRGYLAVWAAGAGRPPPSSRWAARTAARAPSVSLDPTVCRTRRRSHQFSGPRCPRAGSDTWGTRPSRPTGPWRTALCGSGRPSRGARARPAPPSAPGLAAARRGLPEAGWSRPQGTALSGADRPGAKTEHSRWRWAASASWLSSRRRPPRRGRSRGRGAAPRQARHRRARWPVAQSPGPLLCLRGQRRPGEKPGPRFPAAGPSPAAAPREARAHDTTWSQSPQRSDRPALPPGPQEGSP